MALDPLIDTLLHSILDAWDAEYNAIEEGGNWVPGAASALALPRPAPSDRGGALAADGGFPVDEGDGTAEQRDPAQMDAFWWPTADFDADGEGYDMGTP